METRLLQGRICGILHARKVPNAVAISDALVKMAKDGSAQLTDLGHEALREQVLALLQQTGMNTGAIKPGTVLKSPDREQRYSVVMAVPKRQEMYANCVLLDLRGTPSSPEWFQPFGLSESELGRYRIAPAREARFVLERLLDAGAANLHALRSTENSRIQHCLAEIQAVQDRIDRIRVPQSWLDLPDTRRSFGSTQPALDETGQCLLGLLMVYADTRPEETAASLQAGVARQQLQLTPEQLEGLVFRTLHGGFIPGDVVQKPPCCMVIERIERRTPWDIYGTGPVLARVGDRWRLNQDEEWELGRTTLLCPARDAAGWFAAVREQMTEQAQTPGKWFTDRSRTVQDILTMAERWLGEYDRALASASD